MIKIWQRLDELIRPKAEERGTAVERLGMDLMITAIGLAAFGFVVPPGVALGFRFLVAIKVAAAFLLAFVVCLAPIHAIKTFFEVEAPFSRIVGSFARHLALGGVFATAAAGIFAMVRKNEAAFDGGLALALVGAMVLLVLLCRKKGGDAWLPPFPATMAVVLFLSVLGQGAWAFRPYLDPAGPTLFAAKEEWLTGDERAGLERAIKKLARRPPEEAAR
jgi:hypothetical protein